MFPPALSLHGALSDPTLLPLSAPTSTSNYLLALGVEKFIENIKR
jgi:hypothetical protein